MYHFWRCVLKLYKEQGEIIEASIEQVRFAGEVSGFHKYFEKNARAILGLEDEPKILIHHENIEGKEIDYLIVDSSDRVYFVEIKLGKNQENRRKVINQIIDYWSRSQNYVAKLEISENAIKAISEGYVNPVIITDELLDDHRYLLPVIKLGANNIKIRLIEVKRWEISGEVFVTTNTINNQEPISIPTYTTREFPTKEGLLVQITDTGLLDFARKLDKLMGKHGFRIKQRSKSRLAYTISGYNRLFVFVCANPVFGDQIGDFIVTTEYQDIGIDENIWVESNIGKAGRQDDWGGEVYALSKATEKERIVFLNFLEKVLLATKKHLNR